MDELRRCQMVIEAVLQLKAQLKMGEEFGELGELVLEILEGFQDKQVYALIQEAVNPNQNRQVAIECVEEAISHLHHKIDVLQANRN